MKIRRLSYLLLVVCIGTVPLLLITNSCQHDGPSPDEFETICFEKQILPIFQNSCATSGCHDAYRNESGYNFSDYAGIMSAIEAGSSAKSKAYQAITSKYEGLMPPGSPLPQDKRMLIRLWIDQGAQETSCTENVTDTSGNAIVEQQSGTSWACFDRDIKPILQNTCAVSGCHDAATHEEGVDLSSYSSVLRVVNEGDPSRSKLYSVITRNQNSEEFMPPKPYSPLSQAAIDTIYSWISRGAQNEECATCDTTGTITYDGNVKSIIDLTCVSCHGNYSPNGGIKLLTKSDVETMAKTGDLLAVVKREPGVASMPPSYVLPDCEVRQIELWIEQGYN